MPLEDLTPAQLALLPTIYARLTEVDPLELPSLLAEAAEARDVVTLAVFLAAPRTKLMRLAVTNDQLDAAREAAAGPLPTDKRRLLARLRELVGAAEATRRALVGELRRVGKLDMDPLVLAAFGAEQDKPANNSIATMAAGDLAEAIYAGTA